MDKSLSFLAKLLLVSAGGLAVIAGLVLFLFPTQTASYFAWAIKNPLTSVFMGANYFGGVGAIWAMKTNKWSVARVLAPGIFVFAITQLFATWLHIPIFNWSHPVAWAWLAVYLGSPLLVVVVSIQMERHYYPPSFPRGFLPRAFPAVTLAIAATGLVVGLSLWVWPSVFSPDAVAGAVPWWPWSLTPLTARVIGGWYLASAALFAVLSLPHPPISVHVAVFGVIFATGFELLGGILYRSFFDGPPLSTLLYLLNASLVCVFALATFFRWTQETTSSDTQVSGA